MGNEQIVLDPINLSNTLVLFIFRVIYTLYPDILFLRHLIF